MAGLLSIGTSALAANQAALNTAGHNIANVNTAGYSRQSVVTTTRPGQFTGSGFYGNGVDVTTVVRNYNDFQSRQVAVATAISSSDAARYQRLSQLEQVFPTGTAGLGSGINQFLNAFSDVVQSPTDLSARSVVLSRADELAARFRTASSNLDEIQNSVTAQLKGSVAAINSLATQIAAVNKQIGDATGSGQTPNDLMDARDQLVRDLNKYIQTSSIPSSDGTVTVMVAGGQPLVSGANSASVVLKPNSLDPTRQVLYFRQNGQDATLGESSLGGGELSGLMKFQNTDLQLAKDQLWKMALTVGDALNKQNQLGVDLSGTAGGNVFNLIPVEPTSANAGTATLNVSVNPTTGNVDPTALVRSDYVVSVASYNAGTGAGTVNITRLSDGSTLAGGPFAFSNPPSAVVAATADGLDFEFTNASATLAAGDTFTIRQSAAAGRIASAITSPTKLAMANAVVAVPAATNTGSLALDNLQASQANPNLSATVTLTFDGAGGFTVAGAVPAVGATVSYYPGQPITYNGWTLSLKGVPAAGDTITVQANDSSIVVPGGTNLTGPVTSDAGNARAMLNLRDKSAPLISSSPISDIYANVLSDIGIAVQGGKAAAEISKSLVTDAEQARAAISGVNLDEEAAKLIQFQQSYQASGKMLQVSQAIFDSLLQAVR
ncbi:MAG: flagellar hook-associated protein FlgK [Gammaproteobacteria bacterium]|nr:flagellar hook-associated protein FlgK [Gammaproteobacteria bacterium]MBU0785934.1 flagellar hook-associated protein FlgK [Gammaproteobacteria bacterium]MBU0816547.1 flagellar hook-associated protein FlgK [Gammaproteobacteria bacterium]MBU1788348.1 flagellar hook-associated protein FlgK [Gammaproteobacteria bacterium]